MANTATSMHFAGQANDPDHVIISEANGLLTSTGPRSARFGMRDWTAEIWAYPTSISSDGFSSVFNLDGVNSEWCDFGINSTDVQVYLRYGDNGNTGWYALTSTPFTMTLNRWHHFVIMRTGNLMCLYANGELIATTALTTASGDEFNWNEINLGSTGGAYYHFQGYLDHFRLSSVALYGNIDIPTTQLNAWQTAGRGQNALLPHHTKLLIQANSSTTTSSSVIDQTGRHTVTSTAAYSQGQTLFGNTALYFDGTTNDKISIPASSDFTITTTNNFSIEWWNYPTAYTSGANYFFNWNNVFIASDTGGAGIGTNNMRFSGHDTDYVMALNTWAHLAFGRVNGRMNFWVNGQLYFSAADTTAHSDGTGTVYIGNYGNGSYVHTGYMDGIRMCFGQSAYTPYFTPYGGLKNLAVDRGGAVTDARHPSANTHAIRMGQAAIGSTLATNANTYCLDFDGTADYLIHNTGATQYRSSDDRGTVFAWIYPDVVNAEQTIFAGSMTAHTHTLWGLYLNSNAKLAFQQRENDTIDTLVGDTSLSATTWQSVAITSTGTTYALYVNGTAQSLTQSSGTNSGEWFGDTTGLVNIAIGSLKRSSAVDMYNGKIMQVAYWGGSSGTTGVLDADAIAALHAAGKGYDIKGSGNTGNYDSWADDLKGYWRMGNHYLDSAGNITIHDASGYGYDMHGVSNPLPKTWTTGTTFLEGWQDRGYFTGDKYTSLLIQSAHANGSTTFTDSGPGFKKTLFDGASDYAHKTSVSNYRQGDDRGTINAWVKLKDYTSRAWFCATDTSGTNQYYGVYTGSTGLVTINRSDTIGDRTINTVSLGTWNMITVTEESNQDPKFYVNGELWESTAFNRGSGSPSNPALLGTERWFGDISGLDIITVGALAYNTGPTRSDYFDGSIAQVGVWSASSGTDAVLTAAQISAMYDLGPGGNWKTSYSSGLVDYWTFGNQIGEGTDTASTIYSQVASGNDLTGVSLAAPYAGHTISPIGSTTHNAAQSVFGGSSIYFPGSSNQELTIPDSSDWYWGTGDYTIEMWHYGTATGANKTMISWFKSTSGPFVELNSGNYQVYKFADGSGHVNVGTYIQNQWNHIAATRQDGIFRFYVNGINEYSNPNTTDWNEAIMGGGVVNIGTIDDSNDYFITGYLDEIHVSSGISRYSPSIERFANTFVPKGDTGDAFTLLQIQSNGAKNGTEYSPQFNITGIDSHLPTGTGGLGLPNWSSAVGDPFGGANTALYFRRDGTAGNQIKIEGGGGAGKYRFGTSDFTIEMWIKADDMTPTNTSGLISCNATTNSNDHWKLRLLTSGKPIWGSGATDLFTSPQALADNRYYHLAVVRSFNVVTMFIDGVSVGSVADSYNYNGTDHLYIGYNYQDDSGGDTNFTGYLDQIRVSNVARYGNIKLPTTQQVVTSSNSDSGVITSNSTFGTGTDAFTTDSYTAVIVNGNENFGGTATATISVGGSGPGPVSSGTATLTNQSTVAQRQGVSAFGANSYFIDGTVSSGTQGLYVQMSNNTALENVHSFTVEGWWKFTSYSGNRFLWNVQYDSTNEWDYDLHGCYTESTSLIRTVWPTPGTNPSYVEVTTSAHQDNIWHHFAWTYDYNTQPYPTIKTWVDGQCLDITTNSNHVQGNKDFSDGKFWINNGAEGTRGAGPGFVDSYRFSANILRYGYTGTNTKLGLNTVHQKNCMLLITSNTYHGNTQIDDFSDQGNYWNQQPLSYYFDGTNDIISTPSTTLGTAHCAAAWVSIFDAGSDGGIFGISGSTWALHHNSSGVLVSAYNTAVYDGVHGTIPQADGQWHHVAVIKNGATTTNYLNGVQAATTGSGGTTAFDGVKYIGNLSSSGTNWFKGRIAQVAAWNSATAISAANIQSMWEAGPTANWMTNYSTNMHQYYAMGNHNDLAGSPADTASTVYDRSGGGYDGTTGGSMYAPNRGNHTIPTGVYHSTNNKNFGTSAIYFDGTNDKIVVPQFTSRYISNSNHAWTMEAWVFYDTGVGTNTHPNIFNSSNDHNFYLRYKPADQRFEVILSTNGTSWDVSPANVDDYAFTNAWNHVAMQYDMKQLLLIVNGQIRAVLPLTSNIVSESANLVIGTNNFDSTNYFWNGYMDEIGIYNVAKYKSIALSGQATITPSYLNDPTGGHFTTSSMAVTDQLLDTPENNFCTLNSIGTNLGTLTQGNLYYVGAVNKVAFGTMAFTSGKWYHEVKMVDAHSLYGRSGFFQYTGKEQYQGAQGAGNWGDYGATVGYLATDSYQWGMDGDGSYTSVTHAHADSAGDVVMYAMDLDDPAGKAWIGVNGAWFTGDPNTGEQVEFLSRLKMPGLAFSGAPWTWGTWHSDNVNGDFHTNFGQGDPDGENNFTDSNGRGGFRFEPPAGFLSWCTANMKDADFAPIGPNSAAGTPDKHFDTLLWTGNGNSPRAIGGLNFQPDLVWMKSRTSGTTHNALFDSVRGINRRIISNQTGAEDTQPMCQSFDPGGFVIGDDRNNNNENFVAWCWKAGNETVVNTDGDLPTTISVNQDAGFSIISYDNRSATLTNYTLGHGLNQAPEFILVKNRGKSSQFAAFHKSLTANYYLAISDTDAQVNYSGYWPSGGMTATTIKVGNDDDVAGQSNGPCIMYAWHGVEGFSKFGHYEANGNADGPFVYLGFKPAMVIIKNMDGASTNWMMWDNKRSPDNPNGKILRGNTTDAENAGTWNIDMVSNGFKIRTGGSDMINNNQTHIYMAWAEMPFKYANAR